jgi:replicative DNA helicase
MTETPAPSNVDLDAEQFVLGQVLDWPEAFGLYDAAGLTTTDFYRQVHAWVWNAACDCASDGLEVAYPNIACKLREHGRFEEVGAAYLGSLTQGVPRPSAGHVAPYVSRLKDLASARRAHKVASDFAAVCAGSHAGLDAETLADHVAQLDAVRVTPSDAMDGGVLAQLTAMGDALTRGDERAIKLGIPMLDDTLLGGVRGGDVCGVLARTSVGKTLLACHVALTAALAKMGQVFVSLEMPRGAIVARLARSRFGVTRYQLQHQWQTGAFPADAYRDTFDRLLLVDTPDLSLERIEQIVRTQQRKVDVALVTIDYLGLIGAPPGLSTYDRISQTATGLKGLAKRCNVAVVVLIQANRSGGQDGSERLSLTAARDAGVVEEALDILVGMRRVDHSAKVAATARAQYEDVIWAEVLKHRHGSVSTREVAIRVNPSSLALSEDARLELDEATARQARKGREGSY